MNNTNTLKINRGEYRIQSKLTSASHINVYNAVKLNGNETIAVKIIPLANRDSWRSFKTEVNAIQEIQPWEHQYLVNYHQFYIENSYGIIAMQKYDCDLLSFIITRRERISEDIARSIFQKICIGLNTMHSYGIAHLDIKPENIMYDIEKNIPYIGDFGCAFNFLQNENCSVIGGTSSFHPPEYEKGYVIDPRKADVYSLGVTLFVILTMCYPYNINMDIGKRKISLEDSLSHDCKNLLRKMLKTNPKKRISLKEVMKHPWLSNIKKESKLQTAKSSINKHVGNILGCSKC